MNFLSSTVDCKNVSRHRTYPEDVVRWSEGHDGSLDDVLETLQKQSMKLEYAVDAAEQLLHLVVRQERLAAQRLQVALDQVHQVLQQNFQSSPSKLKILPNLYRISEYKRLSRARPSHDFYKIFKACGELYVVSIFEICGNSLKEFRGYGGLKLRGPVTTKFNT